MSDQAGITFDSTPAGGTPPVAAPAQTPRNPQGSGTQSGITFDTTPIEAPAPIKHDSVLELEETARRIQHTIQNAPSNAEGAIADALKKHLPAKFGAAIDAARTFAHGFAAADNPLQTVADIAASPAQIAKGGAEMAQDGKRIRGAANVAMGVANLAPVVAGAVGAVSKGASAIKSAFTPALESFTPPSAPPPIPLSLKELLPEITETFKPEPVPHPSEIQPDFQQGLHDIFNKVTRSNGGLVTKNATVPDAIKNTIDTLQARKTAIYKTIDDAMGGTSFQSLDDKVSNLYQKLRNASLPDKFNIKQDIADAEETRQLMWDKAQRAGAVTPEDAQFAQTLHRQYEATRDLYRTFVSKMTPAKPGAVGVPDANGVQQYLDPSGLYKKLSALQNSTKFGGQRVTAALGEDADTLLQHVGDYLKAHNDIAGIREAAIKSNREKSAALQAAKDAVDRANNKIVTQNAQATTDNVLANIASDTKHAARVAKESTAVDNANAAEKARVSKNWGRVRKAGYAAVLGGTARELAHLGSDLAGSK